MLPFGRMLEYGNIKVQDTIVSIPGNFNTSFVLLSNGDMYGSGANSGGAFGDGTSIPVYGTLKFLRSNVKYCNMGSSSVYIDNNNRVFWSGSFFTFNSSGNIINSWSDVTSMFNGIDITNIKHISPGYTSFVLMNDGKLYGRGFNRSGTVGTGNTAYVNTWTLMADDVKEIYGESGGDTLIQIRNDGTIWGTGNNNGRGLGVSTNPVSTPIQMFTSVGEFEINSFWFNGSACVLITNDNKLHMTGSDFVSVPDFYKTVLVPFNVGDCSKLYHPMHSGNVNSSRIFLWNQDTGILTSTGYKDVNGTPSDVLPIGTNFVPLTSFGLGVDINLGGLFYGNVWFSTSTIWMNGVPPSSTGGNNYSYSSVPLSYNTVKQTGLPF